MASFCSPSVRGAASAKTVVSMSCRAVPRCAFNVNARHVSSSHKSSPSKGLSMSQVRKTSVIFTNTGKKNLRVCAQGRSGENSASGLSELPHFGVALGSKNAGGGAFLGQTNSGAPHARSSVVASAQSTQSAKENKTSKLFMEMESTKLELMEQELKAARSKNYKVADSLTAAVKQIDEVMVRYKELMQEEMTAVQSRDYVAAAGVKRSMTGVLRVYGNLRGRNFWVDEDVEMGEDGKPVTETQIATHAPVRFHVTHALEFGARMHIVGSIPELGAWSAEEGLLMQWTKGDIWVCHVDIPLGSTFQYKFVVLDGNDGGQYWQEGENRECEIPSDPAHKVDIAGSWTRDEQTELVWFCLPIRTIPGTGGDPVDT
eukprot:CAMPEP_0198204366 /NCGR_PEP_ID=MMETSP1445-20131203/7771_1 /TAXON_ID=36898 /ORGANISM="Pyramimonas sp., Strain CCMP2087" /LENGTH=372 /DNA_ID=CAMNT_0043876213 /DNA_START=219 /DNA_END=1337 /DNA_ORIENTATION=+